MCMRKTIMFTAVMFMLSFSFSHAASLLVRCSVPGASVSIDSGDGKVTNNKGMVYINDISPGNHQITVTKEGYDVYSKSFTVDEQLTTVVNVPLSAGDKNPPEIMLLSPDASRGMKPVVSGDMVEVSGLVRDESNISSVAINGKTVVLFAPPENERNLFPGNNVMKFASRIALRDGDNTVKINVIDEWKNETVLEQVIVKSVNNVVSTLNMSFHALLIGIDNYDNWPDLVNPVNDVTKLSDELKNNYGFQTTVLVNANKNDISRSIRDVAEKKYPENSELLIVMSGHGHFDEFAKTGYFVPANGKKIEDDSNFDSYIAYPILQNIITNTGCKHVLLVLDACFGGTFNVQIAMRGGEETYKGITAEEFVTRKLAFKTRLMLSSGGKEYVPDGRLGQHSPFMRKFLEGLRDYGGPDKILTIEELKVNYMNYVEPQPYLIEFERGNDPGSSFLFIAR